MSRRRNQEDEVSERREWAFWQRAAAWVMLLAALALFTISGLSPVLFGKIVDFGVLPWSLLAVSVYVIFGLNLPNLLGKDK